MPVIWHLPNSVWHLEVPNYGRLALRASVKRTSMTRTNASAIVISNNTKTHATQQFAAIEAEKSDDYWRLWRHCRSWSVIGHHATANVP